MSYTYSGFGLDWQDAYKAIPGGDKILAEANAYASKIPDKYKRAAAAFAYAEAKKLALKVQASPEYQAIIKAGGAALDVGKEMYGEYQRLQATLAGIKGGFTFDPAGFGDVLSVSSKLTKSVFQFLSGVGFSVPREATVIADTMTTMAAGISSGPGGMVTAAVASVFNIFKQMFGGKPAPWYIGPSPKRAYVLFAPNAQQMPLITADTMRLAALLRYHYGVQSYAQLWARIREKHAFVGGAEGYRLAFLTRESGYAVATGVNPAPPAGYTLLTALAAAQAVQFLPRPNARDQSFWYALRLVGEAREAGGYESWSGGVPVAQRYRDQQDINYGGIVWGAKYARQLIQNLGVPMPYGMMRGTGPGAPSSTYMDRDWYAGGLNLPYNCSGNMMPFLHVDEWLNFFQAITIRELQVGLKSASDYIPRAHGLPLRFRVVGKSSDRTGHFEQTGEYKSPWCWTNLYRGGITSCSELRDRVNAGQLAAIQEFSTIRLMSAFSLMHMFYLWSDTDVIANLSPIAAGDATRPIRVPIDPRQTVTTRQAFKTHVGDILNVHQLVPGRSGPELAAIIATHEAQYGPVIRDAKSAALSPPKTLTAVSPYLTAVAKQMTSSGTVSANTLLWQAMQAGKLNLFIRPDLMPADMAPPAFVPGASVPAGMQPPTPPVQPPAAGVGILPIAAVAGLALLFLRR